MLLCCPSSTFGKYHSLPKTFPWHPRMHSVTERAPAHLVPRPLLLTCTLAWEKSRPFPPQLFTLLQLESHIWLAVLIPCSWKKGTWILRSVLIKVHYHQGQARQLRKNKNLEGHPRQCHLEQRKQWWPFSSPGRNPGHGCGCPLPHAGMDCKSLVSSTMEGVNVSKGGRTLFSNRCRCTEAPQESSSPVIFTTLVSGLSRMTRQNNYLENMCSQILIAFPALLWVLETE